MTTINVAIKIESATNENQYNLFRMNNKSTFFLKFSKPDKTILM